MFSDRRELRLAHQVHDHERQNDRDGDGERDQQRRPELPQEEEQEDDGQDAADRSRVQQLAEPLANIVRRVAVHAQIEARGGGVPADLVQLRLHGVGDLQQVRSGRLVDASRHGLLVVEEVELLLLRIAANPPSSWSTEVTPMSSRNTAAKTMSTMTTPAAEARATMTISESRIEPVIMRTRGRCQNDTSPDALPPSSSSAPLLLIVIASPSSSAQETLSTSA